MHGLCSTVLLLSLITDRLAVFTGRQVGARFCSSICLPVPSPVPHGLDYESVIGCPEAEYCPSSHFAFSSTLCWLFWSILSVMCNPPHFSLTFFSLILTVIFTESIIAMYLSHIFLTHTKIHECEIESNRLHPTPPTPPCTAPPRETDTHVLGSWGERTHSAPKGRHQGSTLGSSTHWLQTSHFNTSSP